MAADDLVERVANDLADGRPIDWDAVLASARSDDERDSLNLRGGNRTGRGYF